MIPVSCSYFSVLLGPLLSLFLIICVSGWAGTVFVCIALRFYSP